MKSSERNIKIISIVMIVLALFMLTRPCLKITGIDSDMREKVKATVDAALAYSAELGESYDRAEYNYYVNMAKSMKDLALSPVEMYSLASDTRAYAKQQGDMDSEGKRIMFYLFLYEILFLLTIAAGIYAIVYAIRRKPLLKGFDGFIFAAFMAALGLFEIILMFYLNSKTGELYDGIGSMLGEFGMDADIGFRITLWVIIGVILALPYNVWENVLAKSSAGQKALEKVNQAAEKAGQAIDKGNEKIQEYSTSWICPNCGTRVAGDALFCSKCGTRKPEEAVKPQPKVERPSLCPECGAPISKSDHFCQHCGYNIDEYVQAQEEKAESAAQPELPIVELTQDEADNGAIKSVEIPGGKKVRVKLPGNLRDGKKIRLKGIIPNEEGTKDDLVLRVRVK